MYHEVDGDRIWAQVTVAFLNELYTELKRLREENELLNRLLDEHVQGLITASGVAA